MAALRKRYYLIDHRILFFTGFVFYLLTPVFLGKMKIFADYPGVQLFQGFFNGISDYKINAYLLISLSWLVAFYLGHIFFKFLKPCKRQLELFPANYETRNLDAVAFLLCCCLIIFAYIARGGLLGGEVYSVYKVGSRAKLSTLVIVFDFFLIYQLISKSKISKLLVLGTVINVLILIFAGSRLTALQSFVIFLVYKTSFAKKRWKISHILLFGIAGFIIGGTIGIWRAKTTFSFTRAGFSMMAEPLFTWFSTASFLSGNDIPAINFPENFLTSFLNLIPNTFLNLNHYIVSMQAMGYTYSNPLGADSIWTTLVINFGWIGSIIFVFIMGLMLNFLRHLSENSHFWATYYILVCGLLPFEFFRTGFFILNKELFSNFILIPVFILLLLKMENFIQIRMSTRETIINR